MDKSRLTDQQIEHLVQRSLFNDAARVSARGGTFFAIHDRLGDQDRPGLRHRISEMFDRISEAIWRIIPVSKGRMAQVFALVSTLIVIGAYFALQGSADDAGSGTAAEPTVASLPTATLEPTVETKPTATMVPTVEATPAATAVPIVEATPLPISKAFPAALESDASPLSSEDVISSWTAYLSDTRILGDHPGDLVLTLCEDGTGSAMTNEGPGYSSAPEITWEIRNGGGWNGVTLLATDLDPDGGPARRVGFDIERLDGVTKVSQFQTAAVIERICN